MYSIDVIEEQLEFQSDKISHLESLLLNAKTQLLTTEDAFKQSVVTIAAIEHEKTELLSEVTKLKSQLISLEQTKVFFEDKCRRAENELSVTRITLREKDAEVSALRHQLTKIGKSTAYIFKDNEELWMRDDAINATNNGMESITDVTNVASVLCSTPRITCAHNVSPSACSSRPPLSPSLTSHIPRATSVENVKPKTVTNSNYSTLPHSHSRGTQVLTQIQQQLKQHEMSSTYDNSCVSPSLPSLLTSQPSQPSPTTAQHFNYSTVDTVRSASSNNKHSGSVTFGKKFFRHSLKVKRGLSAPDLNNRVVSQAQEDQIISVSTRSSTNELQKSALSLPPDIQLTKSENKPKGLRKIFSRPKRSPSTASGFSDSGSFTRGALRSTTGPRVGYSPNEKNSININLAFHKWDTSLVAEWFSIIGLGMYSNDCKRWCKNGEHVMRATATEIEKDLGIRSALHRKKLRLAVSAMSQETDELTRNSGQLDYLWVARWLDDIGLPQYKDTFLDARIDGRVLHYLTVEDLMSMKINSQLHHASIKCGIRVLREHNFDTNFLKRRAAPDESTINEWTPSEIKLWTSHRVMEWLRSIDLSEYAPNLRGSGVHGAIIVYENSFNSDLLATLLSIPSSKTLLRRHISTKFKQLIGNDLSKIKRDFECQSNYIPMTPGSKIKAHRRGQFTLIKKRKSDVEYEDYVCPLDFIADCNNKLESSLLSATIRPEESISTNVYLIDSTKNVKVTDV